MFHCSSLRCHMGSFRDRSKSECHPLGIRVRSGNAGWQRNDVWPVSCPSRITYSSFLAAVARSHICPVITAVAYLVSGRPRGGIAHTHAPNERGISNRATDRVGDRRVASSSSSNSNGPGTLERLRLLRRQWPIHDLSRSRARRGCELFCLLARGVERTKNMPKRGEASECEEGVLLQGAASLRSSSPIV